MTLLDADLQSRTAGLEFVLRRPLPSDRRGERRSPVRKGTSLEFCDYRPYAPGDDVRHLEWKAYARLDQLVVKVYHDEEDLAVHILVDDSASMACEPGSAKADYARRLAAALAWIGVAGHHRVSVGFLGEGFETPGLVAGTVGLARLLEFLERPPSEARAPLSLGCAEFASRQPRGLVLLISDLLVREGPEAALRHLQLPGTDLAVIQILSPEEVHPEATGDLRLIDSEGGPSVEVSLDATTIANYERVVREFVAGCGELCRRRGVGFAQGTTDRPLEEFLARVLVRDGVLR